MLTFVVGARCNVHLHQIQIDLVSMPEDTENGTQEWDAGENGGRLIHMLSEVDSCPEYDIHQGQNHNCDGNR